MKRIAIPLFCLLAALPAVAASGGQLLSGGKSPAKIRSLLLPCRSWVKYPAYNDRQAWDTFPGDNKQTLIARGEQYLDYKWAIIKATDYLEYERSGERNIMQTPNAANNEALIGLAFAELAEGKGRFIDQIINGVFYHSERTSWVLSAHLPRQKSRRALPDYREQIIDLGSAETGAMLAWVYYFFRDAMDAVNPAIAERLHHEIYQKIILPFRNTDKFWWMGFDGGMVNNWNPWCNSNVLQCLLLLENDSVQLSNDIYRTMCSVDRFIDYVHADGACEEGPSYWEHAAGKLYDYLQLLDWATAGQLSVFHNEMIKNMGEYISRSYVGNNWVVNFADASAGFSADKSLIYRYGKAVNSREMMHFSAFLNQNARSTMVFGTDFLRTIESIYYDRELKQTPAMHLSPSTVIYPETQFYYLKNRSGFFLAAKGGHNNESHNHNDVGTFSLWIDRMPVFIDAGVGTYTRQTFGPERYSIWTMRSLYHNLPEINGYEQQAGKEFHVGEVLCDTVNRSLNFDIAPAYPPEAGIRQWYRSYRLGDAQLVVTDRFILREAGKPNEIHFLLRGNIHLAAKGKVFIEMQGRKVELLYDDARFTPSTETVPLPDIRLSRVWGKEIYRLTLKDKHPAVNGMYRFIIRLSRPSR
ncbi:MAG: heparinase II/III-family protein [Dysgonamonadaceae bacterium]|jgi:hypothetical protein|nr:heparinase II/III-family protein [Dysgonamonadaceae bacterium]